MANKISKNKVNKQLKRKKVEPSFLRWIKFLVQSALYHIISFKNENYVFLNKFYFQDCFKPLVSVAINKRQCQKMSNFIKIYGNYSKKRVFTVYYSKSLSILLFGNPYPYNGLKITGRLCLSNL